MSVIGTSVSGKLILLIILGLPDNYDDGQYYLNGEKMVAMNEMQAAKTWNLLIGSVFQAFNLINFKNALE